MTEEESRIFEEKVAEHKRQIAEKGYAERDGESFHEIETVYGKVWYNTFLARQERIFRNVSILHMMMSSGVKVDPARIHDLATYPPFEEKLDEWVGETCAPEDIKFIDKMTGKAIKYFSDNLRRMFAANMLSYVEEAFFYGLIKTVGEENPNPPNTESRVFTDFIKIYTSRVKERLDIQKATRKPDRTDDEMREMLALYESILPVIREAKKDYTSIKDKSAWVEAIKALYPQLPVDIIEKFDQQGVSPSELALTMVAERFNTDPTEYLRQLIIKTRASGNENK